MNIIIFGFIFSVLVVQGIEESCMDPKQLESTCGNYCLRAIKPALDHAKALQIQVMEQQQTKQSDELEAMEKLIEAKFSLQDKKIGQKITDLHKATETLMQKIESQDEKIEQKLQDLHKLIEERNSIIIKPYQKIGSKYYYIEETQKYDWFNAINECTRINGYLVKIQNREEYDAIKKKLKDDEDYWIYDLDKASFTGLEEIFHESDSTDYDVCEGLSSYHNHKVNDIDCLKELFFICEPKFQKIEKLQHKYLK